MGITEEQTARIIQLMQDKHMTFERVLDLAEDLTGVYLVDLESLAYPEAQLLISSLEEEK